MPVLSPTVAAEIITLALRIVLLAMESATPEQRQQLWAWHIRDVERWRRWLRIDSAPEE